MRLLMPLMASIGLCALPIQANAAQYENADVRAGAFVGARLKIPLGGHAISRPRASLAVAPTIRRISSDGEIRTAIGEGVELNAGWRTTLTLMGVPADQALGLRPSGQADEHQRQGISSGGWVAIGVGAAVVAAGIFVLTVYDPTKDNSD